MLQTTKRSLAGALAAAALSACCGSVPESVRVYAGDLPARANGQYALLDDPVKKQLVMKDSLLQCKIDQEDGMEEKDSKACRCSTSSNDWLADCKDWLGEHTPAAAPPAPAPTPDPAPDPS